MTKVSDFAITVTIGRGAPGDDNYLEGNDWLLYQSAVRGWVEDDLHRDLSMCMEGMGLKLTVEEHSGVSATYSGMLEDSFKLTVLILADRNSEAYKHIDLDHFASPSLAVESMITGSVLHTREKLQDINRYYGADCAALSVGQSWLA